MKSNKRKKLHGKGIRFISLDGTYYSLVDFEKDEQHGLGRTYYAGSKILKNFSYIHKGLTHSEFYPKEHN